MKRVMDQLKKVTKETYVRPSLISSEEIEPESSIHLAEKYINAFLATRKCHVNEHVLIDAFANHHGKTTTQAWILYTAENNGFCVYPQTSETTINCEIYWENTGTLVVESLPKLWKCLRDACLVESSESPNEDQLFPYLPVNFVKTGNTIKFEAPSLPWFKRNGILDMATTRNDRNDTLLQIELERHLKHSSQMSNSSDEGTKQTERQEEEEEEEEKEEVIAQEETDVEDVDGQKTAKDVEDEEDENEEEDGGDEEELPQSPAATNLHEIYERLGKHSRFLFFICFLAENDGYIFTPGRNTPDRQSGVSWWNKDAILINNGCRRLICLANQIGLPPRSTVSLRTWFDNRLQSLVERKGLVIINTNEGIMIRMPDHEWFREGNVLELVKQGYCHQKRKTYLEVALSKTRATVQKNGNDDNKEVAAAEGEEDDEEQEIQLPSSPFQNTNPTVLEQNMNKETEKQPITAPATKMPTTQTTKISSNQSNGTNKRKNDEEKETEPETRPEPEPEPKRRKNLDPGTLCKFTDAQLETYKNDIEIEQKFRKFNTIIQDGWDNFCKEISQEKMEHYSKRDFSFHPILK